jgi:DNA-binding helix-hairpin-helix protein with protein kinase domain
VLGHRPAVHPADTVGWADPAARPGEATLDSDRYKLALVVLRLLLADHAVVPGDLPCHRLDRPLMALAQRAVVAGGRPSAGEWLAALAGGAGLVQPESVSRGHARGVGS